MSDATHQAGKAISAPPPGAPRNVDAARTIDKTLPRRLREEVERDMALLGINTPAEMTRERLVDAWRS